MIVQVFGGAQTMGLTSKGARNLSSPILYGEEAKILGGWEKNRANVYSLRAQNLVDLRGGWAGHVRQLEMRRGGTRTEKRAGAVT